MTAARLLATASTLVWAWALLASLCAWLFARRSGAWIVVAFLLGWLLPVGLLVAIACTLAAVIGHRPGAEQIVSPGYKLGPADDPFAYPPVRRGVTADELEAMWRAS